MTSNRDPRTPLGEIALTPADSEAMRHSAEEAAGLSGDEYLRFLERASAHVEPSRRTSAGWLPFKLPDTAL
jgi:hypothetical protein